MLYGFFDYIPQYLIVFYNFFLYARARVGVMCFAVFLLILHQNIIIIVLIR